VKKKVYCQKCAYFLLIKGTGTLALCTAKSKFASGPVRQQLNVIGVTFCVKRNRFNNCKLFVKKISKLLSVKDRLVKSWLRRSLNASKATLKDYSEAQEIGEKERGGAIIEKE
jgi:hypothetical protein